MKSKRTIKTNKMAMMLLECIKEGDIIKEGRKKKSLMNFMCNIIVQLRQLGKDRTSETYTSALKSFMMFRNWRDLSIGRLTPVVVQEYEAWLKMKGISMNTT